MYFAPCGVSHCPLKSFAQDLRAPPTRGPLLRSNLTGFAPCGASHCPLKSFARDLRTPPTRGPLLRSNLTGFAPCGASHCPLKSFALSLTGFALSKQHLPILSASSQIGIYCFGTARCFRVHYTENGGGVQDFILIKPIN